MSRLKIDRRFHMFRYAYIHESSGHIVDHMLDRRQVHEGGMEKFAKPLISKGYAFLAEDEYTGEKDANNQYMFENDIVRISFVPGLPTTGDNPADIITIVHWGAGHSNGFRLLGLGKDQGTTYSMIYGGSAVRKLEVIDQVWRKGHEHEVDHWGRR